MLYGVNIEQNYTDKVPISKLTYTYQLKSQKTSFVIC